MTKNVGVLYFYNLKNMTERCTKSQSIVSSKTFLIWIASLFFTHHLFLAVASHQPTTATRLLLVYPL
jgi:hypothetical protein